MALSNKARRLVALAVVAGSLGYGAVALAQPGHDSHGAHNAPTQAHGNARSGDPHAADHGGGHHGPGPMNWVYGLLGEKEGAEPSLLFRPKGMPVPFLANLINFGILAFALVHFGRKPLAEGLVKRKDDLTREIDEAARVKAEAERRLADYEGQLSRLDEEKARILADYKEQGARDKERIIREARERRDRMKRDAEFLLEQERKALRLQLLQQTVDAATAQAEALLRKGVTAQDQDRLAQEYLQQVGALKLSGRGVA